LGAVSRPAIVWSWTTSNPPASISGLARATWTISGMPSLSRVFCSFGSVGTNSAAVAVPVPAPNSVTRFPRATSASMSAAQTSSSPP